MQALFFRFFDKKLFLSHYQREKTSKKFLFSACFRLHLPETSVFQHIFALSNEWKKTRIEPRRSRTATKLELNEERAQDRHRRIRSSSSRSSTRHPDWRSGPPRHGAQPDSMKPFRTGSGNSPAGRKSTGPWILSAQPSPV